MTRARGSRSRIRRTASTPSITGMRRSSSVTSGLMALEGVDRLDAVAGFGDDVQVGLLVDDVGDAGPQQRVIVDEQHARAPARGRRRLQLATCDLRRQRRRLPRQHDFGAAARRGDDGQRRADALGALLHAGHAEARPTRVRAAMPRPSSATDSRKPIERTRGRADRDPARARVAHGVGQRLLRDADDLALDAVAEARQLVDRRARSARRSCAAPRSARRLQRGARCPRRRRRSAAARRPIGALRSGACAPDRPRSRASRRPRGGSAPASRCAACSCIRMAAKPCARCRGCRARAGCAPRGSPCAAPRRGCCSASRL